MTCSRFLVLVAVVGLVLALPGCKGEGPAVAAGVSASHSLGIEANTRGVALMGRFDYAGGVQAFHEALQQRPDWTLAKLNLAIATLNRQQAGDSEAAKKLAQEVLSQDPQNLTAHYILGILGFNDGAMEVAVSHFETVSLGDPQDAYGWYFYGQSLFQQGQLEPAREAFEKALSLDPYLRSAYYGAFLANQRLRNADAARSYLAQYQRLDPNPRSRLAEIKYTRMGEKALVKVHASQSSTMAASAAAPAGELFTKPEPLPQLGEQLASGATPDFTLARLEAGETQILSIGPTALAWSASDSGIVSTGSRPGFLARAQAVSWGDIDNDGDVDAAVVDTQGGLAVWLANPDRSFQKQLLNGDATLQRLRDVLLIDADHDGDLDVLIAGDGAAPKIIYNLRNGSYRIENAIEDAAPFDANRVMPIDVDGDDDLDLIWFSQTGPELVLLNDRLWNYAQSALAESLEGSVLELAVASDLDADGHMELLGRADGGRLVSWQAKPAGWERKTGNLDLTDAQALKLADFDGNGADDLLVAWQDGIAIYSHGGFGDRLFESGDRYIATLQGPRGPELIVEAGQSLARVGAGPGRHDFVALDLSGMEDQGASMRSNASAVGARVALRAADQWSVAWRLRRGTGAGSDFQLTSIGLNGATKADFIAIDWPDGVYQTELALAAGEVHRIEETQRQLASCPVLFAWNGERHAFVSDVLGVGGIGFAVGRDEYASPRPWERFQLPDGSLQPLDGEYVLKITEPMEEAAYLDRVGLTAYDLPPGIELVLDERMGTGAPQPLGKAIYYDAARRPIQAWDENNRSVLTEILDADRQAVDPGYPDRRFAGLMQERASLTLEFGQDLGKLANPVLLFDGWVEYGYSQTYFAAWQAGVSAESASLDIRTPSGWQAWLPAWGYPAGMPRRGSLPLGTLPTGTTALRLRTNQEIYWDRLSVVDGLERQDVKIHALPLTGASVRKTGFPLRIDHAQRVPEYDYAKREPFWDAEYQEGLYTALGPADLLVAKHDNTMAIIGPGDELEARFRAELPILPDGWHRAFVVELNGWAKDMDLYTRDGDTLEPMPRDESVGAPDLVLEQRYNSRFQAGR